MAETQVADPLVGTLVDGRYRVRDRVARGGMATVYTAVDERLERTVALKMIHPQQAREPRFVERFIDEARAIARLTHPHVVAAYDQGSHHGLPYLVLEYVRGRTLRDILRQRSQLTPAEALTITEQVLAALAAAHRAGLVHRDIKPENVLVVEAPSGGTGNLVDSVIKVTDFGLAQAVAASTGVAGAVPGTPGSGPGAGPGAAPGAGAAGTDPDGGAMLATPAYVAPELVTGGRADPRSDVYSTGIVLFEMLTGRVPYDGNDSGEVAWRHVDHDVPPPSKYLPELPTSLDELVLRATRRDRDIRPSDAGELLTQVQILREKMTAGTLPRAARTASNDATMVISRLQAPERPSWARLPQHRGRPVSGRRTTPREPAAAPPVAPDHGGSSGAPGGRTGYGADGAGGARRSAARAGGSDQRQRALLAAGVAAVVLLVAVGGWWFGFGRWVSAPALVGLADAEAVALAEEHGLDVSYDEPRHDDTIAEGHVLAQDPDGRVARGGTVTVTLSLGPEIRPLPDVVGAEVEVATRQLEQLGLLVIEGEPEFSDTVPEGRVLTVDPPVGEEVGPGDEVTVIASKGRAPIDVPQLIGEHLEQARAQVEGLGLVIAVERVESEAPEGEVLAQDPSSGTGVESGATVRVEVSEGPPTRPVPDVEGERCRDVEDILADHGFETHFALGERGRVMVQMPRADGTELAPGEEVTVWCSR